MEFEIEKKIDIGISTNNMAAIRWFSDSNSWMDFFVFVPMEFKEKAAEIIPMAMHEYWDSDDDCYGDLVEWYLSKENIPFFVIYHSCDDETDEYEDAWDSLVSGIDYTTVSEFINT